MRPQTPRLGRAYLIFAAAALAVAGGLAVDALLVLTNLQLGQAAVAAAAAAAATAVAPAPGGGWELRLADQDGQPSAYTAAEQALGDARGRVTLTAVVSDGGQVVVRGVVSAPTLFVRLIGIDRIPIELAAGAALQAPAGSP